MNSNIEVYPQTRALIFDIDGTLLDTMTVHYKASQIVCNARGFDFPKDFFYAHAGIPTIKVFELLMKKLKLPYDGAELGRLKDEKYLELVNEIKPLKEVFEIALAHKDKLPMALGTGGTREVAFRNLAAAGIGDMFDIVVTADDVVHGKPHPDTFLQCAEKMGIDACYCQVFEDADPGIRAAISAGMMYTDIRKFVKTE